MGGMQIRTMAALVCLAAGLGPVARGESPQTVVFVCEHGNAKSVVAAAHFNRLARERGLPYRAASRGIHPEAGIPENIRAGLLADGLKVGTMKPAAITERDLQRADRIVMLSCELPKSIAVNPDKVTVWPNLPALGDGYQEARAAIVARIEELLTTMGRQRK